MFPLFFVGAAAVLGIGAFAGFVALGYGFYKTFVSAFRGIDIFVREGNGTLLMFLGVYSL